MLKREARMTTDATHSSTQNPAESTKSNTCVAQKLYLTMPLS
jgi:hypothetical protein